MEDVDDVATTAGVDFDLGAIAAIGGVGLCYAELGDVRDSIKTRKLVKVPASVIASMDTTHTSYQWCRWTQGPGGRWPHAADSCIYSGSERGARTSAATWIQLK